MHDRARSPCAESSFAESAVLDLPPRLRNIAVDNKEPVRSEAAAEAVREAEELRRQLACVKRHVEVLKHARAADQKLARSVLQDHATTVASLKQQIESLEKEVEAKVREARAERVASKAVNRQVATLRGAMSALRQQQGVDLERLTHLAEQERARGREVDMAQLLKRHSLAEGFLRAAAAPKEPEVHVMLCLIRPESIEGFHLAERQAQAEAAVNASHLGRATYDAAAVAIQAAFRGHVTRQDLRRRSVLQQEDAALKIQAVVRGRAARQQVARIRRFAMEEAAAAAAAALSPPATPSGNVRTVITTRTTTFRRAQSRGVPPGERYISSGQTGNGADALSSIAGRSGARANPGGTGWNSGSSRRKLSVVDNNAPRPLASSGRLNEST
eukprot:jgi/Botrbrau1/12210/Bobra.0197s0004.2